MFNNLGDRFKDIFKKVSGQGKLTENNMVVVQQQQKKNLNNYQLNKL